MVFGKRLVGTSEWQGNKFVGVVGVAGLRSGVQRKGQEENKKKSVFTLITTRSQKSWSWGIGSKLTTPENSRCCVGPSSSWLLSFGNDLQNERKQSHKINSGSKEKELTK